MRERDDRQNLCTRIHIFCLYLITTNTREKHATLNEQPVVKEMVCRWIVAGNLLSVLYSAKEA